MSINRRMLITAVTGVLALSTLSAFTVKQDAKAADRCSIDQATDDVVKWVPDVGHPVFWGYQDLGPAEGAPGDTRIYYPTLDGAPQNARIAKQCDSPYPVVLFLHGQPPAGQAPPHYNRDFDRIGADLARSGYVVVAPAWRATLVQGYPAWSTVAEVTADLEWVRFQWSESQYLDTRIQSTAVVGHSYGALLAARFADMFWDIGAFVSLSGPYVQLNNEMSDVLHAVEAPSFYAWAEGEGLSLTDENLDTPVPVWDDLSRPKYATVFKGEHFDYLDHPGLAQVGPCHPRIGHALADLATLFVARNLRIELGGTEVPIELTKPHVDLTWEQEFYAGGHLLSVESIESQPDCHIDMRWDVNGETGNREIGP